MFLAGLPLTLLLPSRARHRNRLMSGGSRPRPYYTEVRPGVLRHFCGDLPSQVMYQGLIEPPARHPLQPRWSPRWARREHGALARITGR